jgi:hypothetical protein
MPEARIVLLEHAPNTSYGIQGIHIEAEIACRVFFHDFTGLRKVPFTLRNTDTGVAGTDKDNFLVDLVTSLVIADVHNLVVSKEQESI